MKIKRMQGVQYILWLILCLVMIVAIAMGTVKIEVGQVWQVMYYKITGQGALVSIPPALTDIIWDIRTPRVILAALVGAGLSLAGCVMQASVQNPLAEPFILGIASGASVGAVVAILLGSFLGGMGLGVAGFAFLGAILSTIVVLILGGIQNRLSTVRLVLAGAVVNALCVALSNFIIYMAADAEGMQTATFWTMGSLADAKWSSLFLPLLVVGSMTFYFLTQRRTLDVLLLGEEAAITLGVDANRKRRIYMTLIALLTGILVSQCGVIGFVGLVIPHMVRNLVGTSHKEMLPAAMLVGAIFLVLADLLSRVVLASGDLPIGIITALLGAPLFMKLLFGSNHNFGG